MPMWLNKLNERKTKKLFFRYKLSFLYFDCFFRVLCTYSLFVFVFLEWQGFRGNRFSKLTGFTFIPLLYLSHLFYIFVVFLYTFSFHFPEKEYFKRFLTSSLFSTPYHPILTSHSRFFFLHLFFLTTTTTDVLPFMFVELDYTLKHSYLYG